MFPMHLVSTLYVFTDCGQNSSDSGSIKSVFGPPCFSLAPCCCHNNAMVLPCSVLPGSGLKGHMTGRIVSCCACHWSGEYRVEIPQETLQVPRLSLLHNDLHIDLVRRNGVCFDTLFNNQHLSYGGQRCFLMIPPRRSDTADVMQKTQRRVNQTKQCKNKPIRVSQQCMHLGWGWLRG